jgi:transposase
MRPQRFSRCWPDTEKSWWVWSLNRRTTWYWLVDALQAAGYRVHLANTAAIKRYEGLKHSDDEDDAAYLAQLLRLEILPSGYICPPAARAVRDLARKRMQLVRSRTAQVLSVENMLSRETGAGMRSYAVQRLTAQAVEGFGFNPEGCGRNSVCSPACRGSARRWRR